MRLQFMKINLVNAFALPEWMPRMKSNEREYRTRRCEQPVNAYSHRISIVIVVAFSEKKKNALRQHSHVNPIQYFPKSSSCVHVRLRQLTRSSSNGRSRAAAIIFLKLFDLILEIKFSFF